MSFILDALKKSESDRQQKAGAEFAAVPTRDEPPGSLRWLWILALLLAVNLVALLFLLFGRDPEPAAGRNLDVTVPAAGTTSPETAAATDEPSFADQVAAARAARAERLPEPAAEPASDPATTAVETATPTEARVTYVAAPGPSTTGRVPTIDELRLQGTLSYGELRDLHLDIHVFSEVPAERFVFINMTKYREQDQLEEGPAINEITPEGVVLAWRGDLFLLPRE